MNTDLMVRGTDYVTLKAQAQDFVKSRLLPEAINTAEAAFAIAVKGLEVGMPPMQAFSQINVIKGKPTISAEGMQYLIRKNCPKAKIEILERTKEKCHLRATRPGETPVEFTWTLDDAKTAQLLSNPSWTKYPKNMLFARALSDMARSVFPDCIAGISYTAEEMGAEVDEEGHIINVEFVPVKNDVEDKKTKEQSSSADQTEKKVEGNPFDPANEVHSINLRRLLSNRSISDESIITEIFEKMKGKLASDLDKILEKLK